MIPSRLGLCCDELGVAILFDKYEIRENIADGNIMINSVIMINSNFEHNKATFLKLSYLLNTYWY